MGKQGQRSSKLEVKRYRQNIAEEMSLYWIFIISKE